MKYVVPSFAVSWNLVFQQRSNYVVGIPALLSLWGNPQIIPNFMGTEVERRRGTTNEFCQYVHTEAQITLFRHIHIILKKRKIDNRINRPRADWRNEQMFVCDLKAVETDVAESVKHTMKLKMKEKDNA